MGRARHCGSSVCQRQLLSGGQRGFASAWNGGDGSGRRDWTRRRVGRAQPCTRWMEKSAGGFHCGRLGCTAPRHLAGDTSPAQSAGHLVGAFSLRVAKGIRAREHSDGMEACPSIKGHTRDGMEIQVGDGELGASHLHFLSTGQMIKFWPPGTPSRQPPPANLIRPSLVPNSIPSARPRPSRIDSLPGRRMVHGGGGPSEFFVSPTPR